MRPVVGQWVQHNGSVFSGFYHLIKVADGTTAHRAGKWAVRPDRIALPNQKAPHEIRGAKVVMAGNGDKGAAQAGRHVLHKTCLATAGGTFDQQWQLLPPGMFKQLAFGSLRRIVGRCALCKYVHGASTSGTSGQHSLGGFTLGITLTDEETAEVSQQAQQKANTSGQTRIQ
jgi:hypothetical protein